MIKYLILVITIILYVVIGIFIWCAINAFEYGEGTDFSDIEWNILPLAAWPLLIAGLLILYMFLLFAKGGLLFGEWLNIKFKRGNQDD